MNSKKPIPNNEEGSVEEGLEEIRQFIQTSRKEMRVEMDKQIFRMLRTSALLDLLYQQPTSYYFTDEEREKIESFAEFIQKIFNDAYFKMGYEVL